MKKWDTIFYVLGTIPWLLILPLWSFYLHAGITLGHLPSYNNPDPKELEFYEFYHYIINYTNRIWAYSFLVWLLLTIIFLIKHMNRNNWKPWTFSLFSQLIIIFQFFNGLIGWYID